MPLCAPALLLPAQSCHERSCAGCRDSQNREVLEAFVFPQKHGAKARQSPGCCCQQGGQGAAVPAAGEQGRSHFTSVKHLSFPHIKQTPSDTGRTLVPWISTPEELGGEYLGADTPTGTPDTAMPRVSERDLAVQMCQGLSIPCRTAVLRGGQAALCHLGFHVPCLERASRDLSPRLRDADRLLQSSSSCCSLC